MSPSTPFPIRSRHVALAAAWMLLAVPVASAEDPFAGRYDVKGTTVDIKTGATRRIEGTVVLVARGDGYSSNAELSTNFPTEGGAIHADVIGSGTGQVAGDVLSGTAKTQLIMQTVPGVDTEFAFIPRNVGPRLVSTWSARWVNEVLVVELSNEAAAGETYTPTKTTLRGKRVKGSPASK